MGCREFSLNRLVKILPMRPTWIKHFGRSRFNQKEFVLVSSSELLVLLMGVSCHRRHSSHDASSFGALAGSLELKNSLDDYVSDMRQPLFQIRHKREFASFP